jgi:hypothetical protein
MKQCKQALRLFVALFITSLILGCGEYENEPT